MIEVKLNNWDEKELQHKVVEKVAEQVIRREFKLYGEIPEEGCYTPYDKFKNYVANLVADRIFEYMIDNDEVKIRVNSAIERAEKAINNHYFKSANKDLNGNDNESVD